MEHFDGLWAEINPREHERFVKDPGEERALSRQWERKRMRGPRMARKLDLSETAGDNPMSKCLDPFRFLLISLAVWMNQPWPTSPARSSRVVMTAATLVSVMNGWRAGGMRRFHDFGVSCLIRGVSGTLAGSHIPKFRTEM